MHASVWLGVGSDHAARAKPDGRAAQLPSFGCTLHAEGSMWRAGPATQLLTSQSAVLESMLHCITHAWPCILVGGAATGALQPAQEALHLLGHRLGAQHSGEQAVRAPVRSLRQHPVVYMVLMCLSASDGDGSECAQRAQAEGCCMPAGKTTLVRQAAQLCGEPLVEVALHSGTDASDLLGGFEQHSPAATGQVVTTPAVSRVWTLHAWADVKQCSVWHLAWAWLCSACVVPSLPCVDVSDVLCW